MTISDQINLAWKKKQLTYAPPKYIALLERLRGQWLNSEESRMCEELYILNMVTRFVKSTWMPDNKNPQKSWFFPEVRYVSATNLDARRCDECEVMKLRIIELEEMLASKTVTCQQVG